MPQKLFNRISFFLPLGMLCHAWLIAQTPDLVSVQSQQVQRTTMLPGEIFPYQRVTLHARVNGYVESVFVDRGSNVKKGQLLAILTAPELASQTAEVEARVQTAESSRVEAEAQLAAAEATYGQLKAAAETPGAIAGNELVLAEKRVDAARAVVRSAETSARAAKALVTAAKQTESYLRVTAPFSGAITDRYVHPGALVGPGNGSAGAMLELQQVSRLRLAVPVPESQLTGFRLGTRIEFRVPAYPGKTFAGKVARIDRAMDPKTRTMPVELDVINSRNELSPGMYPEVTWLTKESSPSLLVPQTAVVTTTERTFVIRVRSGRAEWINVRKGAKEGEMVEVSGPISAGDMVVRRGTDEIREGSYRASK